MSWLARVTALTFLVVLFVGAGFAARELGGDLQVVETITTNADGETVTVREGGHDLPGYLFLPFAFFGAIFFWFLAFGLLKAILFGFWGGRGGGGGRGRWGNRRERWEARAREVHEEWHAAEGRGDTAGPGPGADPGRAS